MSVETIKDQIISNTLYRVRNEIESLKGGCIWKIVFDFNSVDIFYDTDEEVRLFEESGASEMLRNQITAIVKPYDKYNVFSDGVICHFTSRQTLNEKYQGNMFYYMKR